MRQNNYRKAFTLTEMLTVTALLGVLATIILTRVYGYNDTAKIAACDMYKGDVEIQAELWQHNTGTFPASNLAAIGADVVYFPGGLPTCPVDSTSYTIDTTTGLVIGHNH